MIRVSTREAKAQFHSLLAKVEAGEEIVITRRGKPLARLVAIERRVLGQDAGRIWISDDFDDPVDPETFE